MSENSDPRRDALRARQRFKVLALAGVLIAGGLLLLFGLEKIPRPMRILAGLGDVFAGLGLLVLARQKFGGPRTTDNGSRTGDQGTQGPRD